MTFDLKKLVSAQAGADRRAFLKAAGALGLAAPLAGLSASSLFAQTAAPEAPLTKLKFATNATAICLAPVFVAQEHGIFKKYGLDVELSISALPPKRCWRRSPPARQMVASAWRCAG